MTTPLTYRQHVWKLLTLGLPLVGSHIAQFAINLSDAIMLGRYNVDALAAQVIGGTSFFILFILGSGFAFAITPLVAEAEESGDTRLARRVTRMSIWASLFFAALAIPVLMHAETLLLMAKQEPHIAALAAQYLKIAGWGILPALLVMVLKSFLSALERTQVVLWVTLAAVAVNVVVNYALIFGNWGMPEMGIEGAALASVAVQVVSILFLAIYTAKVTPEHEIFNRFWRPDWDALGQVFRLGWPIGLTSLAEVGLFAAASLMMGRMGTLPLAAHGIALQLASLTFMVHLGLSNAATVRAGRAVGRGNITDLKRGAEVTFAISAGFALTTVSAFVLLPEWLMGFFLSPDDPQRAAVIAIGVPLLAVAGVFQLADGMQAIALGLLRGCKDTTVPMIIAGIAYWLIGIPISLALGFYTSLEGVGIWIGLVIGLAIAAVLMGHRFWKKVVPGLNQRFSAAPISSSF